MIRKLVRDLASIYWPTYPTVLVYMLQGSEYRQRPYLQWVHRTDDFRRVMRRRNLEYTRAARLLLLVLRAGIGLHIIAGLALICLGIWHNLPGGVPFGLALILAYPFVWAYLMVIPLMIGRQFISQPKEQQRIAASEKIFAAHPGIIIAVAGSYGKTTMKELLHTVLSEGLQVAATPANKNVSTSHARFASKLGGSEDVLIIEYGEGEPGDVARFARLTHPTHAVITGLAPAHLDRYKTLQAAGEDIFSLGDSAANVYVNDESPSCKPFLKKSYQLFNASGALGWKIEHVAIDLEGTSFTLKKGRQALRLHSGLLGQHHLGFLAFCAALALEFGLSETQVTKGIAKTQPFEHRMQPYQLNGAWIIDDTYNGNLEGIRAGTQLLHDLPAAKRKIYVTPGLVDQGEETERVHHEMGRLIARAKPDVVVLMQNSVTRDIQAGLKNGHYEGELQLETNPLEFYTNLAHFVATGDLVVMQNDWTDNYA